MCSTLRRSVLVLSFVILGACTDPDSVSGAGSERGIDADILATHDAARSIGGPGEPWPW